MKKVLIGGGSGLVGSRLTEMLMDHGYEVWHLSRQKQSDHWIKSIYWDINNSSLDASQIEGVDYIINLAGAGIADEKWSDERIQLIRDSRVKSNLLLKEALEKLEKKPELFISASAVGYYGFHTSEKIYTEEDKPGNDLLASVCEEWEASADQVAETGIPSAKVRIGIVLSDEGGALPKIEEPIRWGVGAALGTGKQYMPWIHIDDLCSIFHYIIEKGLEGTYNAAAPEHINNAEFTDAIAKLLGKRIILPNVPGFALKLFMGGRADLVLEGSRISSDKISEAGFNFSYGKLLPALNDLYFST